MARMVGFIVCFGAMIAVAASGSAQSTQTDTQRIAALEQTVAELTYVVQELSKDTVNIAVDDDRLLPIPRPASDFGAGRYSFPGFSESAVKLYCRAQAEAQDTMVSLVCDQVVYP